MKATVKTGGISRVNERTMSRDGREFNIWDGSIVDLEISKVWKGNIDKSVLPIRTGYTGGSCGYHFLENESYILFARYGGEFKSIDNTVNDKQTKASRRLLWTSYCWANIVVGDDLNTKGVIEKLNRLQNTRNERAETLKYTEALQDRIKEILDKK